MCALIPQRSFSLLAGLLLCLLPLAGCMDITGRGPAPLARTTVAPDERGQELAGHVYCMRGWLGIFSTGMDALAVKVNKEVAAVSVADEEWHRLKEFLIAEHQAGRLQEPLVLVGHSWGADDQIRVAEEIGRAGIKVDLLITVDPVTPPPIPENVRRCYNIYKSHPLTDPVPFWRGVEVPQSQTKVPVTNIDLRTTKMPFETELIDHINIEKSEGVHEMVMTEIRKVCPPKSAFYGVRDGAKTAAVPGPTPAPSVGEPIPAAAVAPRPVGTP